MDILGWLWWLLSSLVGLAWSLIWLLIGGWVSTALQLGVLLMAYFVWRHGWRAAPGELMRQVLAVARFASGAMKASEAVAAAGEDRKRERQRDTRSTAAVGPLGPRHVGDISLNLSTLLSVAMLVGLLWVQLALSP